MNPYSILPRNTKAPIGVIREAVRRAYYNKMVATNEILPTYASQMSRDCTRLDKEHSILRRARGILGYWKMRCSNPGIPGRAVVPEMLRDWIECQNEKRKRPLRDAPLWQQKLARQTRKEITQ